MTITDSNYPQNPYGNSLLGSLQNAMFNRWYGAWAQLQGWDPNPERASQEYDYRGLFKSGVPPAIDPTDDNTLHWTSQFKKSGHSRQIVPLPDGTFLNTQTGQQTSIPSYPVQQILPFLRGR